MPFIERVRNAWNAFRNEEVTRSEQYIPTGTSYVYSGISPSRTRFPNYNDRYIIASIFNRISIDVAGVAYRHVKLDDQGRYLEDMKSNLNDCLIRDPNVDQIPRAFRQDIVMTLFYKGVAAIVPVDTSMNPQTNEIFDVYTLRVGEIVDWFTDKVRVSVWNEATGRRDEVTLEKRFVAIVENPLYTVMNEPNSTLQRLIRKLNLLDAIDEQSASGKLDLIIQLPYVIKSEARRVQAEKRREDIEVQLKGSKYGIAYVDGTEKITQLNRPAENNLMGQIEFLTKMLYGQLGITEEVMNGTANEETMINYWNRTVEPILESVRESMHRAFLGPRNMKKAERISYFRDPFKFVPVSQLAEIGDKFTRNEILTSNEFRGFMGIPPSKDPKADQLSNSNMPQSIPGQTVVATPSPGVDVGNGNGSMKQLEPASTNGSSNGSGSG